MSRRRTVVVGVAAGALAAGLAAGCSSSGGGGGDGGRPTEGAARSVLTGEPGAAGRVLAVKIDNVTAARPQTGLNSADLVYGILVEGGLSRLMAIFDSEHLPSTVGPVRSARETDLQLLAQYDRPALAYSGAQSQLLPILKDPEESGVISRTGSDNFFRSSDRPAPHNEFVRTEGLTDGAGKAKDIGLKFGAAVPPGGTPNTTTSVSMPAARFTFTWDGSHYRVSFDGTRSPWTADNVIVQHVEVKESRFHSRTGTVPFSQTVGEGPATILRDGRAYPAQWDRPTPSAGTDFTHAGSAFPLHPGRTWIVLAPS